MVTTCGYSETVKKDVFTNRGAYCGKISDFGLDLEKFRVKELVIDAVKGSFLSSMVGEKRGVIVPFAMVQTIGDIVIIKHITPTVEEPVKEAHGAGAVESDN
jgi:sporulation protein YlmC with PRC-barrel domain